MIYLITGVPGSGKTLYAVSTLIQKLAAEKIKGKDGIEKTRRVCVDGIKDLIFPHDMMAPGVEDADGNLAAGDGDGIWNWPDWCQPGDVIVVDEVQRWWRPRGMGSKPPREIKALETHRHKGIDFVVITQNPMLIDQNVRRLVGRHQNIRRLFGMGRALVYDWDGCSVDVNRTKGATTTLWSYPKDAFKLYKSSELHTKQRQKIPLWVALPVVALVAGVIVAPKAYSTMSGAMTGKGITQTVSSPSMPVLPPFVPAAPMVAAAVSVPVLPALPDDSKIVASVAPFAGCVRAINQCKCYGSDGFWVAVAEDVCLAAVPKKTDVLSGGGGPDSVGPAQSIEVALADGAVLAFMANRKASP